MTTKQLRELNSKSHITVAELRRLETASNGVSEMIKEILAKKVENVDIFNTVFADKFDICGANPMDFVSDEISEDVKFFKRVSHPINRCLVYKVMECVLLENDIKLLSLEFNTRDIYISYTLKLSPWDKLRKLINNF